MMPWEYTYRNGFILWFLLIIPLLVAWYLFKTLKSESEIKLSSFQGFQVVKFQWLVLLRHLLFALKLLGISLLIVALARPQTEDEIRRSSMTNGIDIVIAMDLSASMLSKDFNPNRLEVCKNVASEFITKRPSDQFGLVVYEGEGYTESPLTMDHKSVILRMNKLKTGTLTGGTAIGWGLGVATNRLRESDAKSKVIILLTDGMNNVREVPPLQIAESAKQYGIKVYTIGVGTEGRALSPVAMDQSGNFIYDYTDVKIDEDLLMKIAKTTDGKYFRATNQNSLKVIYQEIDKMEKREIITSETIPFKEMYYGMAFWGIILLLIELIARSFVYRTIV